jgi:formylmethanofuran dehydrogenase subunit E
MDTLMQLLSASEARNGHLCPRQVLGVRIGLAGLRFFGIDPTHCRKSLLVIVETDGCFVNGIEVTARVSVGHRSLRIEDYGKTAATFVHLKTGQAMRLFPKTSLQELARKYTRDEQKAYFVQLLAYQIIPDAELLDMEPVTLSQNLKEMLEPSGPTIPCAFCGEEIIHGREALRGEAPTCTACAGYAYYRSLQPVQEVEPA